MRKPEPIRTFYVSGRGDFPMDMLRYDECEFPDEYEAKVAGGDTLLSTGRRRVKLRFVAGSRRARFGPTLGRWESFTWKVVEVDGESIEVAPPPPPEEPDPAAVLAKLLREALNYIEHQAANHGKLATNEQWDRNVEEFRKTVSEISTGRSYVPKATANLAAMREALADYERKR